MTGVQTCALPICHKIKPGITGLAQSKGYRGETDEFEKLKNRVKLDLFYVNNWSFMLDLKIIYDTVMMVIRPERKSADR